MRRRTSAMIAGALGAGLTASIVLAQQIPGPGGGMGPRAGSGASGASPEPASLYGAAGARGARYLLRNGLDYLQYQQYERALKFLRDAEAKEKELSDSERQELKRGIDQAQAGLRAAADATPAYALSDRSRRRNGFTAARPEAETAIADRPGPKRSEALAAVTPRTEWAGPVAARARTRLDRAGVDPGVVASRAAGRARTEDLTGEPIRLTGAEVVTPAAAPDPQTARGEITSLTAPGLPALTAVPPSSDPSPSKPNQDGPAAPAMASAAPAMAPVAATEALAEPAPAPPAAATGPAPSVGTDAPAPIPGEAAPKPILLETPDSPAAPAGTPAPGPDATPAGAAPAAEAPASPAPAPAGEAPVGSATPAGEAPAAPPLGTPTSAADSPAAPPVEPPSAATAPAPADSSASPSAPAVEPPTSPTPSAPAAEPPTSPTPSAPAMEPPSAPAAEPPSSRPADPPAAPTSPVPAGDLALNSPAGATTASDTAPAPAPATDGLVPVAMKGPAAPEAAEATKEPTALPAEMPAAANSAEAPAPAVSGSEIAPLPPLGADATRTGEVPTGGAASAPVAVAPEPSSAPEPAPSSDELPPLPSDLGRETGSAASPGAVPAAPAADPAPAPGPSAPTADAANRPDPATPSADAPKGEAGANGTPSVALGATDGTATAPAQASSAADDLPPLPEEAGPQPSAAAASTAPAQGTPTDPAAAAAPVPVPVPASEGPADAGEARPIPVPQPEPDAKADAQPPADPAPPAGAGDGDVGGQAPEATPAAEPAPTRPGGFVDDLFVLPRREAAPSTLRPDQERRIAEAMARLEKEETVRNQAQGRGSMQPDAGAPRQGSTSNLQTQTQYDIARAPSPAEARPIKAIPVPEDWVPLAPRNWTPQRKYWAAAATCHMPLYFQDPMLERYGHSVEQFAGPAGRYFTYPVDDPKQSTQRMQILQPVFSLGLFAFQIGVWPYTAVMDPPWETQYDLGYYRPGDMVPTDVYWLPLFGYGPPLHGNHY